MERTGGEWVQLGVFDLATGTGPVVELGNDANQYVIADAVKLTHDPHGVASDEVVMELRGHNTELLTFAPPATLTPAHKPHSPPSA